MSWGSIPLRLKGRALVLAALLFAGGAYMIITRASNVTGMFANSGSPNQA